jgi:protein-S-isoprenylcysteine O-methyltransferase Ste14
MSERRPIEPEPASHNEAGLGVGWVIAQGVLVVFFVVALIAGERLQGFDGIVYLQSAGLLIALFGSFVSIWTAVQHGSRLSPFPKPVEDAVLIETGPYRFVRHPMYSGIIAFVLGCSVAYLVPAAMLTAPAFFVFFLAKTGHEEQLLADAVPGYRAYRSTVHWKLIPRVV